MSSLINNSCRTTNSNSVRHLIFCSTLYFAEKAPCTTTWRKTSHALTKNMQRELRIDGLTKWKKHAQVYKAFGLYRETLGPAYLKLLHTQGGSRNFGTAGGRSLPFPSSPLLLSLFPLPSFPLPLEVGPLKPPRGSGEQWPKTNFVHSNTVRKLLVAIILNIWVPCYTVERSKFSIS